MSNFRIIYPNSNGNIVLIVPAPDVSLELALQTVPGNTVYRVVDAGDVPEDSTFRNAWVADFSNPDGPVSIEVNFTQAQEITRARLREERAPLLAAQDILFQRALETGSDTTAIVAEKNRLRDITKLVDVATDLDSLRALSCTSS